MAHDEEVSETCRHIETIDGVPLPNGLTYAVLKRAVVLVEEWEETPHSGPTDLALNLYRLYSSLVAPNAAASC
jgi:hypothetical protein